MPGKTVTFHNGAVVLPDRIIDEGVVICRDGRISAVGCCTDLDLPTAEQADAFATAVGGVVALKTGRHTFIEWGPILEHQGAAHPDLNPFNLPANARCRKEYSKDMCARSLQILARTVMIGMHPDRTASEVTALIKKIKAASKLHAANT